MERKQRPSDSELTRFKRLWQESFSQEEREVWRARLESAEFTQAQNRAELKLAYGVNLVHDQQLTSFRRWEAEEQEMELAAEREAAEAAQLAAQHPNWSKKQIQEELVRRIYTRALVRGDDKLALKTMAQDVSFLRYQLGRDKFEFDAMALAVKECAKIKEVSKSNLTFKEKINKLRLAAFGFIPEEPKQELYDCHHPAHPHYNGPKAKAGRDEWRLVNDQGEDIGKWVRPEGLPLVPFEVSLVEHLKRREARGAGRDKGGMGQDMQDGKNLQKGPCSANSGCSGDSGNSGSLATDEHGLNTDKNGDGGGSPQSQSRRDGHQGESSQRLDATPGREGNKAAEPQWHLDAEGKRVEVLDELGFPIYPEDPRYAMAIEMGIYRLPWVEEAPRLPVKRKSARRYREPDYSDGTYWEDHTNMK